VSCSCDTRFWAGQLLQRFGRVLFDSVHSCHGISVVTEQA
jgi:hypothetical protein